jgi:hypothetical protein
MPCPRDAAGLWHACALLWVCRKKYMEKNCCNSQYFQGKKYKAKFATNLILKKIKSTKIILEKIIKKPKGKKTKQ